MSVEFQTICRDFDNYDRDGDGIFEIESLLPLEFESESEMIDPNRKLVIVLVESRLMDDISDSQYSSNDLVERLETFYNDLCAEGFQPRFVKANVYSGPINQGGNTLLAIREFLKRVHSTYGNLKGVILVGSFPDAKLTHLYPDHIFREKNGVKLEYYEECGFIYAGSRFDIVLADLDGNWEQLYHKSVVVNRHSFLVSTPVIDRGNVVIILNPEIVLNDPGQVTPGPITLEDTFFYNDTSYSIAILPDGMIKVNFEMTWKDPEVGNQDKLNPNPIATAKICVSRINARSIAVNPPSYAYALDENRKPKATNIGFMPDDWERSPDLERTLLIDYFDRNHAFRSGAFSNQPFKLSIVESGLGTAAAEDGLSGWNHSWEKVENATLLDFTRWLKQSIMFRAISTHADSDYSLLCQNEQDTALVESECGGHPWRWIYQDGQYVTSFSGHDHGDLHFYRTLWENKQFSGVCPSLLLHVGCNVNCVRHEDLPYSAPLYGTFQNAECLLFYANQLAVLCHAGWWNHGPSGFGEEFGSSENATFGDGGRAFQEKWAQDATLIQQFAERKRSYEWSIVGDWTLQKQYISKTTVPNVIGLHRDTARRLIEEAGLVPKFTNTSWPRDKVYSQSPGGGSSVRIGSIVKMKCTGPIP